MTAPGSAEATEPPRAASAALRATLEAPPRRLAVGQLQVLSIVAGGAAGALARAGIARGLPGAPGAWPWATFVANLAGALLLGWLLTRLTERIALTQYWRGALGTGLCGAFTTFSTFQIDTITLARDDHLPLAVAYAAVSMLVGMLCAVAGTVIARWGRYG